MTLSRSRRRVIIPTILNVWHGGTIFWDRNQPSATSHNRVGGLEPPRAVRLGQCWKHSGIVMRRIIRSKCHGQSFGGHIKDSRTCQMSSGRATP
eukprot:4683150-Karenia_brevis.AAC.1